ncbi:MAG: hypothetical protein J2P45_26625, partial [Candidatus Dormibacteraeota bacterium]|nr:hypothetical protein [Candidatus Dormibacteraeota bacterium]
MSARDAKRPATLRGLRALVVATIVALAVQGWFGDTVNIFVSPAGGTARPQVSVSGLLQALEKLPSSFFPLFHASAGLALVVLAVSVLVLSFTWSRSLGVRIWSVVGFLAVLSAALGGYQFLTSGFHDDGSSAQMGGSFI